MTDEERRVRLDEIGDLLYIDTTDASVMNWNEEAKNKLVQARSGRLEAFRELRQQLEVRELQSLNHREVLASVIEASEGDTVATLCQKAKEEIERLRTAIKKHRDQRGDDRCWLDDLELYAAIDPSGEPPWNHPAILPPKCDFLESCSRFWEQRHSMPGKEIGASGMTIGQLQAALSRYIIESKHPDALPDRRFRLVLPDGMCSWHGTREEAERVQREAVGLG